MTARLLRGSVQDLLDSIHHILLADGYGSIRDCPESSEGHRSEYITVCEGFTRSNRLFSRSKAPSWLELSEATHGLTKWYRKIATRVGKYKGTTKRLYSSFLLITELCDLLSTNESLEDSQFVQDKDTMLDWSMFASENCDDWYSKLDIPEIGSLSQYKPNEKKGEPNEKKGEPNEKKGEVTVSNSSEGNTPAIPGKGREGASSTQKPSCFKGNGFHVASQSVHAREFVPCRTPSPTFPRTPRKEIDSNKEVINPPPGLEISPDLSTSSNSHRNSKDGKKPALAPLTPDEGILRGNTSINNSFNSIICFPVPMMMPFPAPAWPVFHTAQKAPRAQTTVPPHTISLLAKLKRKKRAGFAYYRKFRKPKDIPDDTQRWYGHDTSVPSHFNIPKGVIPRKIAPYVVSQTTSARLCANPSYRDEWCRLAVGNRMIMWARKKHSFSINRMLRYDDTCIYVESYGTLSVLDRGDHRNLVLLGSECRLTDTEIALEVMTLNTGTSYRNKHGHILLEEFRLKNTEELDSESETKEEPSEAYENVEGVVDDHEATQERENCPEKVIFEGNPTHTTHSTIPEGNLIHTTHSTIPEGNLIHTTHSTIPEGNLIHTKLDAALRDRRRISDTPLPAVGNARAIVAEGRWEGKVIQVLTTTGDRVVVYRERDGLEGFFSSDLEVYPILNISSHCVLLEEGYMELRNAGSNTHL